tara:strand:+ start:1342 stop:2061 length:720 start_codon:yes stop_codon:yes gene_type:complete
MDNGIWAIWYNLDETGKEDHINWLHNDYLPNILTHDGVVWAAHYVVDEQDYKERRDKLPHTTENIPQGTQYICLIAASSPHIYYQKNSPLFPENQTTEIKERFLERLEARTAVLIEEERVTGPDYRMVAPGGVPAQAIQMGSYNMTSVENEIEIGKWYAQIRLPFVSEVKGAIRARKMVSTVGWAKHSVLYEFTSHEDRRQNIVREFDPFSKKTIGETIHAPGSPSIGHRIWPPVEKQK